MVVLLVLLAVVVILFVVLPIAGLAVWALISTAIVGLVMGALGRLVVPGTQPIGLLATLLLGLGGAIVGSFVGHVVHVGHLLTLLLEVAASAVLVGGYSVRERRLHGASGGRRSELT